MFPDGSVDMLYIEVKFSNDVRKGDEKSAFLEVESSENVAQVKEKVLTVMNLGLLADNYRLYYNDMSLPDDAYLIDHHVQDFDSLMLKCFSSGAVLTAPTVMENQIDPLVSLSGKRTVSDMKAAVSGGRRGVYEHRVANNNNNNNNNNNISDGSGSGSQKEQIISMFKGMVQQIGSVGLCCWQISDTDDDEECYNRSMDTTDSL